MIDVFVRVWAENVIRLRLAQAVCSRTSQIPEARVRALVSYSSLVDTTWFTQDQVFVHHGGDFARESRLWADKCANSPIYALIDDDQMPIGRDWLAAGVAALEAHPEFVMLSSWSVNAEVSGPYEFDGFVDGDVFETYSAGTPCFVRKGTFVDLPDGSAMRYDTILSSHLKRDGRKIGFLRNVRHNHLGYGLSQVVPAHWKA